MKKRPRLLLIGDVEALVNYLVSTAKRRNFGWYVALRRMLLYCKKPVGSIQH